MAEGHFDLFFEVETIWIASFFQIISSHQFTSNTVYQTILGFASPPDIFFNGDNK